MNTQPCATQAYPATPPVLIPYLHFHGLSDDLILLTTRFLLPALLQTILCTEPYPVLPSFCKL